MTLSLTSEQVVAMPRELLLRALGDPAALRKAIPGCERLFRVDPGHFRCVTALRGTSSGVCTIDLVTHDVDAPHGFSVTGELVENGTGVSSGTARFTFEAIDAETTNVTCHAHLRLDAPRSGADRQSIAEAGHALMTAFLSRLAALDREPAAELALLANAWPVLTLVDQPAGVEHRTPEMAMAAPLPHAATGLAVRRTSMPAVARQWSAGGRLPVTTSPPVFAQEATAEADDDRVTGPWRWLMVAIGLMIIAVLLGDVR